MGVLGLMQNYEMAFENYMYSQKLMYFKVVVFDRNDKYIDEFDNYELRNYKTDFIGKYSNYIVTNEQIAFAKNKGYTISTTIIHIKEI